MAKAEQINSLAPLPKDPSSDLLRVMLVAAPYKAPKKKVKKKTGETRDDLRSRGSPDTKSGETHAPSTHEGEEDEDGEESDSSHARKRAASDDIEEVQPPAPKRKCRAKLVLSDISDSDKESIASEEVPQRNPRVKPLAQRYESEDPLGAFFISPLLTVHMSHCSPPREIPTDRISEGDSTPPELAESGMASRSPPLPAMGDTGEVLSQQTPPGPEMGGGADEVMAEVHTSAAEDQGEKSPLVDKEGEPRQSGPAPRMVPEAARYPESPTASPVGGGTRVPSPVRSAAEPAATGQPSTLEEALNNASIAEDHRALMGMVMIKFNLLTVD